MTDGPWPPPSEGGTAPQPGNPPQAGGWPPPQGPPQPVPPTADQGPSVTRPSVPPGDWAPPVRPRGGLMLRTRYFPLAFLLLFFPPRASIDGSLPIQLRWGENPLPGVPPGTHRIRVWFRYMFFGDCGVADAWIQVPEQGMFLEYKAPTWFVFSRGRFPELEQQQATAGDAAGGAWHPDPLGRAEQRWWDGRQWTGHVVRGGQQGWDPL